MDVEVVYLKKKLFLMLVVLAGVFCFVYFGKNSSNESIRKKANEIANDKVIRKILRDYETVETTAKDYMMFRETMKQKNPMLGEKELLKRYVLYTALSKKASEFGLSLSTEELDTASKSASSFFLLDGQTESSQQGNTSELPLKDSKWNPEEWIAAIDTFNQRYLLTQKLEEYLKAAYTGTDFESYFQEYKDALFQLWEKKEGSLDPNMIEK